LTLITLDITKTSSDNFLLSAIRIGQLMNLEEKFYENLQTHQSVDSGNRIIIFLFKTYTDHFFLLFEFFNSLPR